MIIGAFDVAKYTDLGSTWYLAALGIDPAFISGIIRHANGE